MSVLAAPVTPAASSCCGLWPAWPKRSPGSWAFYAAAAALYRDRTWRRLPSDAAITVHAPGGNCAEGRRVHAVVMGQSGLVQGLAVYEDDVALEIARSGDLERTAGSTALSVTFSEAFEIAAIDYDWIECNGFEVAGPEA